MRTTTFWCGFTMVLGLAAGPRAQAPAAAPGPADPVRALVSRLELERYKATIKGLTQFGDRRQGTERNRQAVDWIEAQLKSYGCAPERIKYDFNPPPPAPPAPNAAPRPAPSRDAGLPAGEPIQP